MAETRDQVLTGRIDLDGNTYVNCQFRDVMVVYAGGIPPEFQNCTFQETKFTFEGPAGNTLMFLRMMAPASTGMRDIAFHLAPEFRA